MLFLLYHYFNYLLFYVVIQYTCIVSCGPPNVKSIYLHEEKFQYDRFTRMRCAYRSTVTKVKHLAKIPFSVLLC